MKKILYIFMFLSLVFVPEGGYAQEGAAEESTTVSDVKPKSVAQREDFDVERMPSLFFTYWQHQAIKDAKNKRGVVRPPTQAELEAIERGDELELDPERRYITLGGIVYKGKDNWTIWLNGKRVTPTAVPEEVLDLRVFKDYIEVKWIDDFTKQIFPIRMRAHQRFNMDMRIFLPG